MTNKGKEKMIKFMVLLVSNTTPFSSQVSLQHLSLRSDGLFIRLLCSTNFRPSSPHFEALISVVVISIAVQTTEWNKGLNGWLLQLWLIDAASSDMVEAHAEFTDPSLSVQEVALRMKTDGPLILCRGGQMCDDREG